MALLDEHTHCGEAHLVIAAENRVRMRLVGKMST
jgi:hypothetical protein